MTITNNGATVDNNGKIGKCYSFDGSDDYISLTSTALNNIFKGGEQPFSIALWVFHSDDTRAIIFGDYSLSGAINFNIELSAYHAVRFFWNGIPDKYFSPTIPASQWTHVCLTYDGTDILFYINGELKTDKCSGTLSSKNKTSGSFYLGRDYRTGTTALNGKLNDVRIYNHALSPREVKEIAKGLVCHYTLSGVGGENLLRNTNTGATYWYWSGNGGTRTATATEDGGVKLTAVNAANSGSWSVIQYNDTNFKTLLKPSTTYTASLDIYPPCSTNFGFTVLNGNGTEGLTTATVYCPIKEGRWNHCEWTFTTKDTLTMSNQIIYITGISPTIQGYEIYLKNIKVEEGTKATPWTPNPADLLYTKMGFDDGIEYDVSGYRRNGTKIGTITVETDSPRYWTSSYFDGGDNAISVPFNTVIPDSTTPFTINLWFKKTELGTDSYETLFGGPSGFEMDTRCGNSTTLSLYMAYNRGGNVYSPFNLNEWYMVSLASDRTNEYYYVNGELVKTIEAKTMPTGSYFIGAWQAASRQNIKGYISDFRIYSTCLSEADILALYNNPVSLTSNGALLTQGEVTEV